MGTCCNKNPPYKSPATDSDPPMLKDRAPPIPIEEETIKEVLSETAKHSIAKIRDESESKAEAKIETEEKRHPWIYYINGGDVASDFSKICSLSKSISATTTTAEMMKAEYKDEVRMWFKDNISLASSNEADGFCRHAGWQRRCQAGRRQRRKVEREEGGGHFGLKKFFIKEWNGHSSASLVEWPFL